MSPEHSQAFLHELLSMVLKPEFIYVHQWRMGDMLRRDNRSSMHKVGSDYDPNKHRLLYRAFVKGERPF